MPAVATDASIGVITLNHPPLNILTREVLAKLRGDLAELAGQPGLRVLLLRAEGKHFSAGASVEEHLPPACDAMIREFGETVLALRDFPLPVVAAVRGRCLGGGFELVQAADIVVAADDALLGQPEIALGVFPPAACALLPRLGGAALAAELVFLGESLTAAEAHAAGLVRRVVPGACLDDAAEGLARQIARHSGAALRAAKRGLRGACGAAQGKARGKGEGNNDNGAASDRAIDDPVAAHLRAATDIYLDDLMRTSDALEGLHAFLEKRRPEWSDR